MRTDILVRDMTYQNPQIAEVAQLLNERFTGLDTKSEILRAVELKALYDQIRTLEPAERGPFGQELNQLRAELQTKVDAVIAEASALPPLDITAPFDVNARAPALLPSEHGSMHPLMSEMNRVLEVFQRMGFTAVESREIDDDFHMFEALNFPEGHPARDDYDTFMTEQKNGEGKSYIAPAHTSTMQHRVLLEHKADLVDGKPIAVVIPGRVFRNEDLDARHEHTFYQLEGIYVDRGVNAGHLIATLQTFLQEYYGKQLEVRTNPFYFPFTEPSFEFMLSCPFCDKAGCSICSQAGWIELLGCGMIHPNVLHAAGIDTNAYTGFAWGGGIERLVMMKHGIEDIRYFESGRLDFLRKFV